MPTFSNFKDLKKYAQKKVGNAIQSPYVRSVFIDAMQQSVETEVYDYYPHPLVYNRRGEEGGLSDPRNMVFTSHEVKGDTFISDFENLTIGSDSPYVDREGNIIHNTDSMNGFFISELIENGSDVQHTTPSNSKNGWYNPDGAWSDPRPFAKATAEKLNKTSHRDYLKVVLESEINN